MKMKKSWLKAEKAKMKKAAFSVEKTAFFWETKIRIS